MTIQDWGAIGEILGAIAVFVSLIYLATQIRTSNRLAQQAVSQEISDETLRFYQQISSSDDLASLWIRGSANDPTLFDEELVRYRFLVYQAVIIWQRVYMLQGTGDLHDSFRETNKRQRRSVMGSPGFKAWYKEASHLWEDSFTNFLEQEMKHSSQGYKPAGVTLGNKEKRDN
jgi:hypothetical protein